MWLVVMYFAVIWEKKGELEYAESVGVAMATSNKEEAVNEKGMGRVDEKESDNEPSKRLK